MKEERDKIIDKLESMEIIKAGTFSVGLQEILKKTGKSKTPETNSNRMGKSGSEANVRKLFNKGMLDQQRILNENVLNILAIF